MNVRQVRKKIKSVSNVKKITHSMRLVSAIKMKRAQQAAIDARPYHVHLEAVIQRVIASGGAVQSPLLTPRAESDKCPDLVIVLTGNKGLCGSFNIDLLRYISSRIDIKQCTFITVGKIGSQFLSKTGGKIIADYSTVSPSSAVSSIITLAMNAFLAGTYKRVFVLYNSFVSTLKNEIELAQIMPYPLQLNTTVEHTKYGEYVIEPHPQRIIDRILGSFVEEKVHNAFIQSEAGEHSARMVAMKNATDNANDVLYNLSLIGNRLRQEKITNELLDMITAVQSEFL